MFTRGFLLTAFFSSAIFSSLAAKQALAAHAKAELLADVSAIQPGKPFWLGIKLTMDEGWHVYWKNPGDAGLPTRVTFKLPDGFTAGPLQYPTPHQFSQPGNITLFGYEGTVMLLAQITPPAKLPTDFQGEFGAAVSWLVCAEECVPGKASLSLALGTSTSASPANRELFDDWIGQLPVDAAHNTEISSVNSTISGKTVTVTVNWTHPAPDQAEFFPDVSDDFIISPAQTKSSQNTTVITFTAQPLAGKKPGPTTLSEVLSYQNDAGKPRGIVIPVALPTDVDNNH